MDFNLVKKVELCGICYKLLKANFYRDYYVIIVQTRHDFYCGSFKASRSGALEFFDEVSKSRTEPYVLSDILRDIERQKV